MMIAVDQSRCTRGAVALSALPVSPPFAHIHRPSLQPNSPSLALPSKRWLIAIAMLIAAGASVLSYFSSTTIQHEVSTAASVLGSGDGDRIRDYLRGLGFWGPVVSLGLMVLQAVVAPIPGTVIALANGLAYGTLWGGMLTLSGQTLAAIVCFELARRLGRSRVEAMTKSNADDLNKGLLARWGALGIFAARLFPGLSFDVISYAAGLTRISLTRFTLATIAGAAPQAFLASYLVQQSPLLGWAFAGFSVVSMGALALMAIVRRRPALAPAYA
ncbi:hypothetical protein BH09CHL1_BH09CHL1_10400 [soil metagenome]